ncbi:MAG: polyisoprenoid-binding protein [Elusimicrobia bacterium]|nr:polyisoprenoid-binding protein [Elusimicrobiota bacterium]
MNRILSSVILVGTLAAPVLAETYQIDPAHSSAMFRIRHMVGKVSGRFDKLQGTFDYEKDHPKSFQATGEIDAASINTHVEKRDEHLRSPEFFDGAKCPKLTFKSTKVAEAQGDKLKLHGDLTMHCVTKPVILDVEFGGITKDPWGNQRAGVIATTHLNRKDFGLTWNKVLEAGQLMVGEDVEVTLEIEGTAKKN